MTTHREPNKVSVHQEHEVLLKLESAGLTSLLAQRIIDSPGNDLATTIVRLIAKGGHQETESQKQARKTMGKNFFGIQDAIEHFGINPRRYQLNRLEEIPFSIDVLKECKDTHVLVVIFPLSVLEIAKRVASFQQTLFYEGDLDRWKQYHEKLIRERGSDVAWHLVLKTLVADSVNKPDPRYGSINGLKSVIPKNEIMSSAQVIIYTIIGHFLVTGERLLENQFTWIENEVSSSIGYFGQDGLQMRIHRGYEPLRYVGFISERKPSK